MRIDWLRETFESGLVELRTSFRGFDVVIRHDPEDEMGWLATTISTGQVRHYRAWEEINESDAMTRSLRWVNRYWDLLENGDVHYETIDTSALTLQPDPEEITVTECSGENCSHCKPPQG